MATIPPTSQEAISELVRNRRLNSRSDDEIEVNIDCRLHYRRGWPTLAPLPLKIVHGDAATYVPNYYDQHLPQIRLLLEIQRVESQGINIVHRLPLSSTKTDESTATLFITVKHGSGNTFMAVRDIRKYLAAHDIHVAIEILDERAQRLKTYAILPTETDVLHHWSRVRDLAIRGLDDIGASWVSITLLRRGLDLTRDSCPPTVVISSRDAANPKWWDEVLPVIRNLSRPHFQVELVPEDDLIFDPQEDAKLAESTLPISQFAAQISMGGSCGPANMRGSGTMGAMIRLCQHDQNLGVFGLSNNHVVESDLMVYTSNQNAALSPSHSLVTGKSLVIKAPSDRDTTLKLENLTEAINSHKKRVDGTSGALGLQAKVDMGDESKEAVLEEALNTIERSKGLRRLIDEFDRTAGHVYSTSGYRTVPDGKGRDWILDWSLTKIHPTRLMQNTGFTSDGEISFRFWSQASPFGRRVAKLGRSTGWTTGTVNAAEAVFSSSAKEKSKYKDNAFGWPVVPTPGSGKDFALSGDTGSVVFDAESSDTTMNCWVGLLFAANPATGVGFFTPIEFVLNDIASVTDCKVLEPTLQTQ